MAIETYSVLVQQVVRVTLNTDKVAEAVGLLKDDFVQGASPQQVAERIARARAEHDNDLLGLFSVLAGLCVEPGPIQTETCGDL